MVQTALVDLNIQGGKELLDTLLRQGLSVFDAFWYQSASLGRWRLVLSLLEWDTLGPLAAYERLQRALVEVPALDIPLDDVVLVRPSDPLVERLRNALPDGVWEQPYSGVVLFQESIEAERTLVPVYVYKLTSKPQRLGVAM